MKIGVILPHSKLYGGVKRFFELGNLFIRHGHEFVVFNEKGDHPNWFDFKGSITTISSLCSHRLDVLFFTEPSYYDVVAEADVTQRIFYFVKSGEKIKHIVADPRFRLYANSSNLYEECVKRFGVAPMKALGGIDTKLYYPGSFAPRAKEEPFTVIVYGRLKKKRKGTKTVVKACERVAKRHSVRLILFDTPTDEASRKAIEDFTCGVNYEFIVDHPYNENASMFHRAHVFVSAEDRTGYSNTAAEAMACGIPVIGTKSGTLDFLHHEKTGLVVKRNRFSIARAICRLIEDEQLRLSLAQAGRREIEKLSWENLYRVIHEDVANFSV